MARIESWFEQDLTELVHVRWINGNLFSQDNQGNLVGVKVFDNGAEATLSGTVSGNFIRADGGTVAVTGYTDGNKAYVILPNAAYYVPGTFTLSIKITDDGVVTTLAAITGIVYRTTTDAVVDPGTLLPDIQTLIAQIETAVASIPADYSTLWTSLAGAFSTSKHYYKGQYTTNNGHLWRFTNDHIGSWDNDDAVYADLGSDLNAIRCNLDYKTNYYGDDPAYEYISRKGMWSLNAIDDDTGIDKNNGYYSRTDNYIEINPNRYIGFHIKASGRNLALAVYMYDDEYNYLGHIESTYWSVDHYGHIVEMDTDTKYIRLCVWEQNRQSFYSLDDVLPYIDVFMAKNNMNISDMQFLLNESATCEEDETDHHPYGFRTTANGKNAISKYIPVGKGTTILSRLIDGDTHTDLYGIATIYVYTFDENYNITGFMNPDEWSYKWVATEDCYIRVVVRYSRTLAMTSARLAEALARISVYYVLPVNTKYTWKETTANKPEKSGFLKGVSLNTMGEERTKNEYEFNNPHRATSGFFPVGKGTLIRMSPVVAQSGDTETKLIVYQYDKNFNYLKESYDWEIDEVIHQDGYARIIVRRDGNTTVIDNTVMTYLYGLLTVDYVTPEDGDLLEPVEVRMDKAIRTTTGSIYGERMKEVSKEYVNLAEGGRIGYAWISDIHTDSNDYRYSFNRTVSKRMMNAVKEVAGMAGLDFICVGGDIFDKSDDSVKDASRLIMETLEPLKDSAVPVIVLFGNHDNNVYGKHSDESTRYSIMLPWDQAIGAVPQRSGFHNSIQFADVSNGYFYFDLPAKRKRVICFNGNDPEGTSKTDTWWAVNQAQVQWFCTIASDTPYDIVILTHTPPGTKYGFWGHGDESSRYTQLGSAISAYNSRGTVTLYGTTYDFTNAEGSVKYIHCGHTHFDLDPDYEEFEWGGVPVIVTSCAKAWGQSVGENEATPVSGVDDLYYYTEEQATAAHANTYGWKFFLYTNRRWGTINESLFDVVSMNSDAVKTFRIGAGHDREYEL